MKPQIFNDTIDESPPATVDIEAIIVRERRSGRRRRLIGAGTAALVVVGLATGAVAYAGNAGLGGFTTGRGEASAAASGLERTPWPPETVARIKRELRDVVPRFAPDARLSETRSWGPTDEISDGLWLRMVGPDGKRVNYEVYALSWSVMLGTRGGGLTVRVVHTLGGSDYPALDCQSYHFGECEVTTTADGRRMLIHKTVSPVESDPTPEIVHSVLVDCGNGVAVEVQHINYVPGTPNSDAPPLTLEQLKQIALDPALVP